MNKRHHTFRFLRLPTAMLALVCVLSLASTPASAAHGYGGFGIGQSTMQSPDQALLGSSFTDHDTGWKSFIGFQFNPVFGLELSYIDFGTYTSSAPSLQENWSATGLDVSTVWLIPVNDRFSLLGKLGLLNWNVDDHVATPSFDGTASASGSDLSVGLGGQFRLSNWMDARLEWDRFSHVGDELVTGRSDVDLVVGSLLFKF